MRSKIIFWIYLTFIGCVLLLAYSGALQYILSYVPWLDTAGHFFLLGTLGLVSHYALRKRTFYFLGVNWPIAPLIVAVLITAEEFLQQLSPYRTFSYSDMLANLLGILIFYLIDRKLNG